MVFTRIRLLIVGVAVAAASGFYFYQQPGQDGEYSFSTIGTWGDHSIAVDESTMASKLDGDGDTLTAGVFKTTYPNLLKLPSGLKVSKIVTFVIGVCGYDGIVVMASEAYNSDGELVAQTDVPRPYKGVDIAGSLPTVAYKKLCPGAVTKPPKMTSDTLI